MLATTPGVVRNSETCKLSWPLKFWACAATHLPADRILFSRVRCRIKTADSSLVAKPGSEGLLTHRVCPKESVVFAYVVMLKARLLTVGRESISRDLSFAQCRRDTGILGTRT